MFRSILQYLTVFLLLPVLAFAQGTIKGRVIDADTREPLPGVNVIVKELSLGAATDYDGNYIIERVPAGTYTLEARFLGYKTASQSVTVEDGQTVEVNFALRETALNLEEVVVTGTGGPVEVRKLGNSIGVIDAAALELAPIENFSQALLAREPGVAALPSGGLTGEGARIRIRGSASLSQSNEPIVYIDGVRVDRGGGFGGFVGTGGGGSPSRLDDLDPEAIERIEILKGAAAATLYGTEASNGVIQIFTKRGAVGPPRFSFKVDQGLSWYPKAYPNNTGWARTQAQADTMAKYYGGNIRPYQLVERNFIHELFETGYSQAYSASVSGGSPGVTYFANLRWSGQDGPFGAKKGRWYPPGYKTLAQDIDRKTQASANINVFPSSKLQLRVTTGFTRRYFETLQTNNNIYGVISLAQMGKPELVAYNNQTGAPAFATVNETLQQTVKQNVDRFNGSVGINYRPTEALTLDGVFGVDVTNQVSSEFRPFGWTLDNFSGADPQGARWVTDRNNLELTGDFKGTLRTRFTPSLESTFIFGGQGFISRQVLESVSGRRFPGPGLEVAGAAAEQAVLESFLEVVNLGVFAQEQIGFNDYLFFTVGGRLDANSAFGSEFKAAFYPKVSLSFIASDAPFWKPIGPISSLRFRTALGRSGLQPGAFDAQTTFASLSAVSGPGIAPSNLGNPKLKPEVSTEFEFGTEMGLWEDRIAFEATYWDRTVTDALVSKQFPVTGGFRARQLANIGELKGKGLELGINGNVLDKENVSINVFANAAYLWEKVTDMGGAPPIKVGGSYPRYRNFIIEGYAPGTNFGAKLLEVEPGYLPVDFNGDGQPDSRDEVLAYLASLTVDDLVGGGRFQIVNLPRTTSVVLLADEDGDGDLYDHFLGKPQPDWSGSFGGTIRFMKHFRLYTLFEYKAGNFYVNNLTGAFRQANPVIGRNMPNSAKVELDYATGGVDANGDPMNDPQVRLAALEKWLYEMLALAPFSGLNTIKPADFVRWRELSLTYDVPREHVQGLGLRNLSFTIAARNLALWTKYDGVDPEMNAVGRGSGSLLSQNFLDSVEAFGFALPRTLYFTVRFGF